MTQKRRKSLFILGSVIIGITALLIVYFILIGAGVIQPRQNRLVFTSGSAHKLYDGTEITCDEWALTSGSVGEGYRIEATVIGSQTEVGSSDNLMSVIIYDAEGVDVTDKYTIDYLLGTLTIDPIMLSLSTSSADKLYDGTPLTKDGWAWVSGEEDLLDGHRIDVTVTGTLTNAGSVDNTVIARVYDSSNKDVTSTYGFDNAYGKLTVLRRPLTIFSGSADKLYDGTPLTFDVYGLENGSLLSGHIINYDYDTSLTYPGSIPNNVRASIVDTMYNDVTGNYELTYNFGTLTVYEPETTVTPGGDVKEPEKGGEEGGESGGEEGGESGGEGEGSSSGGASLDRSGDIATEGDKSEESERTDNLVFYRIRTGVDGTVYLRDYSFGDYTGTKWNSATAYLSGVLNPNYLASEALLNGGASQTWLEVTVVQNSLPYMTPYYTTTYDTVGNDVHSGSDGLAMNAQYYCSYIAYDYLSGGISAVHSTYSGLERAYSAFVRENYLAVPDSTKAAMLAIARENGLDVDSPTLLADVRNYIQNAAVYDDAYSFEVTDDIAVYFLTEAKRGICQHFATAATLMYRSLGIPARYTTGFATPAAAFENTDVTGEYAHAWVEIYVDGVGWVSVEVTAGGVRGEGGSSGGGEGGGEIETKPVTVRPVTTEKIYDGYTLYPTQALEGNAASLFGVGTYYDVVISGEQKSVGMKSSMIESLTVYDRDGNDITGNYDITYELGELWAYYSELTITGYDKIREYDGTTLWGRDADFEVTKGELTEGHSFRVRSIANITDVGETMNPFTVTITDVYGIDVTDFYKIDYVHGLLGITKRAITVQTGSAKDVYDGSPLTERTWEIIEGSLPDNHIIEYISFSGKQTDVGTSKNTVLNLEILDTLRYSYATNNFDISYVYGDLTVTKRAITVTTADGQKPYDGTPLTARRCSVTEGSLAPTDRISTDNLSFTNSQTEVGSCENTLDTELFAIYRENYNATQNYDVTFVYGTLTVTERDAAINITVRPADLWKVYDGTPLTSTGNYTIAGGMLIDGDSLVVTTSGSQTEVGVGVSVITSCYAVSAGGERVSEDKYNFIFRTGQLRVYYASLIFGSRDYTYTYDGMVHSGGGAFVSSGALQSGHTVEYSYTASHTNVGRTGNAFGVVIRDGMGEDVTNLYKIAYDFGVLEIVAYEVTVTAGSASKTYDGNALTCDSWTCSELPIGFRVSVTVSGTQINRGRSANIVRSVTVYNAKGEDVTNNFTVRRVNGTLTVE